MDMQSFASFIRNRRIELGITQSELGAKINVTDKAISRWERGIGFPDIKLLLPLSVALGVSIEELMQCKPMNTDGELIQLVETTSEVKEKSWLFRYRVPLALVCFFVYLLVYALANNPLLFELLPWLTPLYKILFLATVIAFLFSAYREGGNGVD